MNEKDRQNKLYDLKIKNLKENYEMKIISLENTINLKKNQLASVEQKAFDIIKRQ